MDRKDLRRRLNEEHYNSLAMLNDDKADYRNARRVRTAGELAFVFSFVAAICAVFFALAFLFNSVWTTIFFGFAFMGFTALIAISVLVGIYYESKLG
jgi:fatty acid desaturase